MLREEILSLQNEPSSNCENKSGTETDNSEETEQNYDRTVHAKDQVSQLKTTCKNNKIVKPETSK